MPDPQKGFAHLLLLIAGVGILIVFTILSLAPFRNTLLSTLFPKNPSLAAYLSNDNFETPLSTEKWPTKQLDALNSVEITNLQAAEGSSSLLIHTENGDDAFLAGPIQATDEIFARIKIKLPGIIPPGYATKILGFSASAGSNIAAIAIRNRTDVAGLGGNKLYLQAAGQEYSSTTEIPVDQWVCLEIYAKRGFAPDGAAKILMNGTTIFDKTQLDTGPLPIDRIQIGSDGGAENATYEFYLDDLATNDTNQIGCGSVPTKLGPIRSNGTPAGLLPDNPNQMPISLDTATPSECKFVPETIGTAFESMPNTFSSNAAKTRHTATVSNLIKNANYTYYVRCKDIASGDINPDDFRIRFRSGILNTTTSPLELTSTYQSISVYSPFQGDENGNNNTTLNWREDSSSEWKTGMNMTPDRRAIVRGGLTNPYKNQWRASVLGLKPNTKYWVRVTYTDSDAITGPEIIKEITTRNDQFSAGSSTSYVSTTGSDTTGDGSTAKPYQTIQKAVDMLANNQGGSIIVRPGTYQGLTKIIKSGTANAFIHIKGESNLTPDQMQNASFSAQKTIIDASTSPVGTTAACGSGNFDKAQCAFYISGSFVHLSNFEIINGNTAIKVSHEQRLTPVTDVIINNNFMHDQNYGTQKIDNIIQLGNTFSDQNQVARITIQNNTILYNKEDPGSGIVGFLGTFGGHVVRNNRIINSFDGNGTHGVDCFYGLPNFAPHGGFFKDTDVYNNYCDGSTDDGIELDGGNMNVRVWGNITKRANLATSITPVYYGPVYIFRNVYYQPQNHWSYGCPGIKTGEGGTGSVYFYHNTFAMGDIGQGTGSLPRCGGVKITNGGSGYTSPPTVTINGGGGSGAKAIATISGGKVTYVFFTNSGSGYTSMPTLSFSGGGGSGATADVSFSYGSGNTYVPNGGPPDSKNVFMRNNILYGYDRVISLFRQDSKPDMDYNLLFDENGNTDNIMLKYADIGYSIFKDTNPATPDFVSTTGQEQNGIYGKANFINPSTGDFRLTTASLGIDTGVNLPGFNDPDSAWSLSGSAPDMGAFEFGSTVTPPTPSPSIFPTSQPSITSKVGDIIANNKVDLYDYNALLTDFGKKNDSVTKADLDDDNDVDLYDYNILLTNFGR